MTPTLQPGHFVLHAIDRRFNVGDIVVARHPSQAIEIVKRVQTISAEGLVELSSDNPESGTDSRHFGRVDPELLIGSVTILLDRPLDRLR